MEERDIVSDYSYWYSFRLEETIGLLAARHALTQEIEFESEDKETRILVTFLALEDECPKEDGSVTLEVQISTDATQEQYDFWDLGGQIHDLCNAFFGDSQGRADRAALVETAPLSDVTLSQVTTEEDKALWRVLIPAWLIIRLAGDRDVSDCHPFDFRTQRISTSALWPSDEMLSADEQTLFALVKKGDCVELWQLPGTQIFEVVK